MKTFARPHDAWLSEAAFATVIADYATAWKTVEEDGDGDRRTFASVQSSAMLLKLFLDQAFGPARPGDMTTRILDRDFGGLERFQAAWRQEAERASTEWLVLGLSYADFRFHLFPIDGEGSMPFCVSPIMAACFRGDVIALSGLTRGEFVDRQWDGLQWGTVEEHLECIASPLDVFADAEDCAPSTCLAPTAGT